MSITEGPTRVEELAFALTPRRVERVHGHASPGLIACLRTVFGLVWVVDAVLKWLPGFRSDFGRMLEQAAMAQPAWLRPMFDLWTGLSRWETSALAFASAATESFLAIALITGFARKSVYLLGASYSLMIWAVGEGFGAPYQSGSTDVGAAVIYTFVFAALYLLDRAGPNALSLDAYLEERVTWWHRVAEAGPHRARTAEPAPVPASNAA